MSTGVVYVVRDCITVVECHAVAMVVIGVICRVMYVRVCNGCIHASYMLVSLCFFLVPQREGKERRRTNSASMGRSLDGFRGREGGSSTH